MSHATTLKPSVSSTRRTNAWENLVAFRSSNYYWTVDAPTFKNFNLSGTIRFWIVSNSSPSFPLNRSVNQVVTMHGPTGSRLIVVGASFWFSLGCERQNRFYSCVWVSDRSIIWPWLFIRTMTIFRHTDNDAPLTLPARKGREHSYLLSSAILCAVSTEYFTNRWLLVCVHMAFLAYPICMQSAF